MAVGVAAPSVQVPNGRSFAELKREVADFVRSPDDPDALNTAGSGINNGIRKLNGRIWHWSVSYQSVGLVQGQMDYALASDYKRSMILERLKANGHISGKYRFFNIEHFEEVFRNSDGSGAPEAFTVFNAHASPSISFNIGPSAAHVNAYPNARHWYYANHPVMSSDQQSVRMPGLAELYLTWYGKEAASAIYRPQLFSLARSERMQVWTDLIADQSEFHLSNWSE